MKLCNKNILTFHYRSTRLLLTKPSPHQTSWQSDLNPVHHHPDLHQAPTSTVSNTVIIHVANSSRAALKAQGCPPLACADPGIPTVRAPPLKRIHVLGVSQPAPLKHNRVRAMAPVRPRRLNLISDGPPSAPPSGWQWQPPSPVKGTWLRKCCRIRVERLRIRRWGWDRPALSRAGLVRGPGSDDRAGHNRGAMESTTMKNALPLKKSISIDPLARSRRRLFLVSLPSAPHAGAVMARNPQT